MRRITLSLLQLNDFYLTELSVKWYEPEGNVGDNLTISAHHAINFEVLDHREVADEFALNLQFKLLPVDRENPAGYEISADILGFFTLPDSEKKAEQLGSLVYNGLLILYGILRGEIAAFTGSFPGGKFLLPTVDMRNVISRKAEEKIHEQPKQKRKKPPSQAPQSKQRTKTSS